MGHSARLRHFALTSPQRRPTYWANPTGSPSMRKAILLFAAASLMLAACNTLAGAGRDAQSAGKAVTKAAKK
jgi:predicted small secreted protein